MPRAVPSVATGPTQSILRFGRPRKRAHLRSDAVGGCDVTSADDVRDVIRAAVSHDLRTPLASIKAAATSLLADDVRWEPATARRFATIIDDQADCLTHMLDGLCDLTRIQAGVVRPATVAVGVADVISAALATLGAAASRVSVHTGDVGPLVVADPGLLERAMANVITNAVTWSPAGVPVDIEASTRDDRVHVSVIDRGPGIPRHQRELVFEPFQRLGDGAARAASSVGLGLAVARGFSRAFGGDLTIEETEGGGATFVFNLRRARR